MANVLLIEPDRLLAANIRKYLEGTLHHSVQWRSDAQASINSSEEFPPDVVVLEMQLGMHSGVEFLYEFRSYADWQHVPIVVLSSVPEAEFGSSTIFWKELEIVAYYYKPDTTLKLVGEAIEEALRVSRRM